MAKPRKGEERRAELRREAEARVGGSPAGQGADLRLLHELKVHQVELELQNQELRESREALEEALERYTDLYEFAPVGYFTLSPEGGITRVNLAGATLLGVERASLLHRNLEGFLSPGSRAGFRSFLEGVFLGRRDASREAGLGLGEPPERFVSLDGGAEQGGRFCRVTMTDITGRKRAEEALRQALDASREAERKVAVLFEAARTTLLSDDFPTAARDIFASISGLVGSTAGYVALMPLGGERSEVLLLESGGRPCAANPQQPMPVQGPWTEAYRMREVLCVNDFPHSRWQRALPAGHMRLDNILFIPLVVDGETLGVMGLANKPGGFTSRDAEIGLAFGDLAILALRNFRATERLVNSEQAQRDSAEAARAANLAKSVFLANMSHEIRTPLNGILGTLQLLETTPLDRDQEELVELASGSSKRLTQLLADILDLARVEAGRLGIQIEPFDLRETVAAVGLLFNPSALRAGIELRLAVDPAIPPRLLGDSARLLQVLNNLVGNAMKFTTAGSVSVEVSALASRHTGRSRILFSVADTGSGIPEDKLGHLFEPFTQASSGYARKFQGAGLGLSICKRLVDLMGGNISIASEVGVGTAVNVSIPFDPAETRAAAPQETGRRGATMAKGVRVLLADDDRVSTFAMVRMLERAGCEVQSVEDGRQALEALRQGRFDLVFMDVQMPVMDGVEATRAIRRGEAGRKNRGIPIVALTAYAMAGDREKFLRAGMTNYIAKPVDMEDLVREVSSGLKG